MRIEVQNVGMRYRDGERDVEVLNNVSLTVESGTSLAIVGESGVGKTTLLYLLGALEQATSGDILLGATSIKKLSDSPADLATFRGKNIGFVFQFHHLLPEFDSSENVMMPLLIRGVPHEEARARAETLLKQVGLGARLTHRPGMLSGGEQQRVAVARAVAGSPGIILADEPTGNLDQKTGQNVTELLKQFQKEHGITLIVVTHSKELAQAMDRVVELTGTGFVGR